jgi:hypothetical protein
VWLASGGQLLASGTEVATPSGRLLLRDVLPGGQVTVSGGDIILAPGSVIDVSGASGPSSFAAAGSGATAEPSLLVPSAQTYTAFSAGGTISIAAQVGAVLEGALLGASGGGNAAGGTLSLTLAAHGGNVLGAAGGIWPAIENTYIVLQSTLRPGDPGYVDGASLIPGNNPSIDPKSNAKLDQISDARIYVSAENGCRWRLRLAGAEHAERHHYDRWEQYRSGLRLRHFFRKHRPGLAEPAGAQHRNHRRAEWRD